MTDRHILDFCLECSVKVKYDYRVRLSRMSVVIHRYDLKKPCEDDPRDSNTIGILCVRTISHS